MKKIAFHVFLFFLTFITTTLAGAEHVTNKFWFSYRTLDPLTLADFPKGLPFSISFLLFLSFHEFGHYFAAVYHRVKCTLPYFIPLYLPLSPPTISIGSMGAIIRIQKMPDSTVKIFDIGIAGPLAGFVISLLLLVYGFTHLPSKEYLFEMNPDYIERFGHVPTEEEILEAMPENSSLFTVGNSLIYKFFETFIANPEKVPNHFEILHYPFLFAGFITLFFTALNLLPIGQLDGGHIAFGLFGRKVANQISKATVIAMLVYGGLGILHFNEPLWQIKFGFYLLYLFFVVSSLVKSKDIRIMSLLILLILSLQQLIQLYWEEAEGHLLWLIFALIAVKWIGVEHPPVEYEIPLNLNRKILGYLAIVIFIISITPKPWYFTTKKNNSNLIFSQAHSR
ncbi:MAG: site-2 protease family protein [Bacteroidia bacterium]|nr:site-2 protease family protein [Bacteroidia bacterium]